MSLTVQIEKRLGSFTLRTDLSSESGTLGLLGASGCGKSMTLKCIAGIEKPDSGRIVLNGRVLFDSQKHINLKPQQRNVGYLFQHYALFPNMTVQENILCGLRRVKDRKARLAAAAEAAETMQLTELMDRRPGQLSGGQQQRAALARILVSQPELLMLDEPFSALDTYLRALLQPELLRILRQYGRDVILVTHNRDEAYYLCDRLAIMENGSVSVAGEKSEVFANPVTPGAARITGCRNISAARKTGPRTLYAIDWETELTCAQDVPDNTSAVGLRAFLLQPADAPGLNVFRVTEPEIGEEPFTVYAIYRCGSGRRRWSVSRAVWNARGMQALPDYLRAVPESVMPLTDPAC